MVRSDKTFPRHLSDDTNMTDAMDIATGVPLFPLSTVLFPDGPLPLRVFEPRYLDMVSRCLKTGAEFGVVLIREGSETGAAAFESVGTLATIEDWYQGSDGILGITASGTRRFKVNSADRLPDGLNIAEVSFLPAWSSIALPQSEAMLAEVVRGVLDDFGLLYANRERRFEDASWVACRLAEILPISSADKQKCLALEDPLEQVQLIRSLINIRKQTD